MKLKRMRLISEPAHVNFPTAPFAMKRSRSTCSTSSSTSSVSSPSSSCCSSQNHDRNIGHSLSYLVIQNAKKNEPVDLNALKLSIHKDLMKSRMEQCVDSFTRNSDPFVLNTTIPDSLKLRIQDIRTRLTHSVSNLNLGGIRLANEHKSMTQKYKGKTIECPNFDASFDLCTVFGGNDEDGIPK